MNFDEAEQARKSLDTKKEKGELNEGAYCAEINKIRVTDAKNCWWQPDPRGPGWLCWNGKEWVAGAPPVQGTVASPAPAPGATGKTALQKPAKPVEYKFRPVSDDEPGYKLMSLAQFIVILKTVNWRNRPRKWWDLFSILTGVALAAIWFVYTFLSPRSEGWDFITPVLMIAIPVLLVSFRKPIDELLMPLQPHRAKLPHLLLLGLGICIPFLTAWVLLNLLNVREYSLIRVTMVAGTCMAYAVTRDPVLAAGFTRKPVSLKAPLAILLLTLVIQIVRGDDCASNPLNGSDCLRTPGYGEGMAGSASAAEAGANAAGDEACDPRHQKELQKWLDTLEPNTWNKRGSTEYMVDDNGVTHVRPAGSGTSSDSSTPSGETTPTAPQVASESTVVDPKTGTATTTTTWTDGKTTTVTKTSDGTTTTVGRDGDTNVTKTNSDGTRTTETTYTDGKKSSSTYDPRDRTTTETDTSGEVTKVYPDGTRTDIVTNPDNSKTETWPDGSTKTTYTDGRTETTGPTTPPGNGSGEGGLGESGDSGETGGFGGEEK